MTSKRFRQAFFYAHFSLKNGFVNTFVGIHWLTISTTLLVLIKVLIFGRGIFFGTLASHIISGFVMFTILRYAVVEGVKTLKGAESQVIGGLLTFEIAIFAHILRVLMVSGLVCWPAILYFGFLKMLSFEIFLAMLASLIFLVSLAYFCASVISQIAIKFPDINHLLNSAFSILFFLSPIIWAPNGNPHLELIAKINPITYYLAIIRIPLIDGVVDWLSIGGFLLLSIVTAIATKIIFVKTYNNIARTL